MKNEKWRMENGEAQAMSGIACVKWEPFLLPCLFFIFHCPFLTLGVFVSSWQNQCEKFG